MNHHIYNLSSSYWKSAILRAALKLNLFNILEYQFSTLEDIIQTLDSNRNFTQAFLETCVALDLIEEENGHYRNTQESSDFLVFGKPKYIGNYVLHITNYWYTWGNLDQLVKEGRTELPFENGFVDASSYWTDYMDAQHARAIGGQGDALVKNVDLRTKQKLLDLGGGTGSYSIALCTAYPKLYTTLVEQKEPLKIACSLIQEQGLKERITLLEGDFNKIDLDTDYDVVLISGVICSKPIEECRFLFQRAYDALLPNGMIIVQDFMRMGHDSQQQILAVMMELYLKIAFDPGASDRQGNEVQSWLEDVGFIHVQQISLPTQYALIVANKT